jgi:hypothetical protein
MVQLAELDRGLVGDQSPRDDTLECRVPCGWTLRREQQHLLDGSSHMRRVLLYRLSMTFVSGVLLCGSYALAQGAPGTARALSDLPKVEALDPTTPLEFARSSTSPATPYEMVRREQAARDLAFKYLDLWSAPKQVTLASALSFYAPIVTFHGQRRTLASVVAEKRRFAQRWPNRTYRHRPETTQVHCEDDALRCTVRSSFDFTAATTQLDRSSLGIGEHELVVSFTRNRPVIVSEDSRVIIRGRGNMTQFLRQRF